MKRLFKALFLMMLVTLVAAAVAAFVTRKKLSSMSDDEIRGFLAGKLSGKVDEDQLTSIQDAVISGLRSKNGKNGSATVSALADTADAAVDSAADAADTGIDAMEDAADEVIDAVADATS